MPTEKIQVPIYSFNNDPKYSDSEYLKQLDEEAIRDHEQELYEKGVEGG